MEGPDARDYQPTDHHTYVNMAGASWQSNHDSIVIQHQPNKSFKMAPDTTGFTQVTSALVPDRMTPINLPGNNVNCPIAYIIAAPSPNLQVQKGITSSSPSPIGLILSSNRQSNQFQDIFQHDPNDGTNVESQNVTDIIGNTTNSTTETNEIISHQLHVELWGTDTPVSHNNGIEEDSKAVVTTTDAGGMSSYGEIIDAQLSQQNPHVSVQNDDYPQTPSTSLASQSSQSTVKPCNVITPTPKERSNPIPRRKITRKPERKMTNSAVKKTLLGHTEPNESTSDGTSIQGSGNQKKKRKVADWLAEGIDPTKLEENVDQVHTRFEKGCECPEESGNCFEGLNPEFVYKHRLNIADLTRAEHDMYLMGVTMATLSNPEATARHTKRQRLRASYVFLGREVCLDAWLYLENCTHYQLKRIRKHLMTHGVSPRVHGNQGKKPHNTFPFRSYQLAFDFLNSWFAKNSVNRNSGTDAESRIVNNSRTRVTKLKSPPLIYLHPEQTRKKLHQEYKHYFEAMAKAADNEQDEANKFKIMGYSSFREFLKVRFPDVKFAKVDLLNAKLNSANGSHLEKNNRNNCGRGNGSSSLSSPVKSHSQS